MLVVYMLVYSFMVGVVVLVLVFGWSDIFVEWFNYLGVVMVVGIVVNLFMMVVEFMMIYFMVDFYIVVNMIIRGCYVIKFYVGVVLIGNFFLLVLLLLGVGNWVLLVVSVVVLVGIYFIE